jgi:hypothetical protein
MAVKCILQGRDAMPRHSTSPRRKDIAKGCHPAISVNDKKECIM